MKPPTTYICNDSHTSLFVYMTTFRAIRSGKMQILHTVLSWGDALGHEWVWDHLHPVQMADGGSVEVSALHLAASLEDGGWVGPH